MAKKERSKGEKGGKAPQKKPSKTPEQKNAEKQALALWALLGEGGEGYGGKLKPEIEKADRDALLRAGLIEVTKHTRAARYGSLSPTKAGIGLNSIWPIRCRRRPMAVRLCCEHGFRG
jgi:hypothetical protein